MKIDDLNPAFNYKSLSREELEQLAVDYVPPDIYYDLRDNLSELSDDALIAIIVA